ncbi:uroporphyrinogen decarboxylase family protein [Alkalibacter mobilis]|uniref:uroporphyrinogen decarboxylase family protein n=1 Tax=Alkalibacter mobilis TaxID=2787712 RepID=UPI00189D7211|nr:uroporphyrinogen decarboxylase family protein [Alkalibacter mobilis]MBF7095530.1 hypothetical protein [Alkalibacter mobilis]
MIESVESRQLIHDAINRKSLSKVPKGELVLDDKVVSENLSAEHVEFEHRKYFAGALGLDLMTHFPKYHKESGYPVIDLQKVEIEKWATETDMFNFFVLDGAFETGMAFFGFHEFCTMVMTEDEEIVDFVEYVQKINMETIRKLADQGADGIILADDIAFQNGLLIRPQIFKDNFLSSMEKQVEFMDKHDLVPFFHSDGNYMAIIEDIINIGFKGVHCIDKKCNVNLEVLKPYAKDLCLWGHLDIYDIEEAKDSDGLNNVIDNIQKNTEFEGFILGTNSGLFSGIDTKILKDIYSEADKRKSRS